MPKFGEFVGWIFYGLLAYYGYSLTQSVKEMSDSISDLNVKMAVVVERDSARGRDVESLKDRVRILEIRVK